MIGIHHWFHALRLGTQKMTSISQQSFGNSIEKLLLGSWVRAAPMLAKNPGHIGLERLRGIITPGSIPA